MLEKLYKIFVTDYTTKTRLSPLVNIIKDNLETFAKQPSQQNGRHHNKPGNEKLIALKLRRVSGPIDK